MFPLVAVTSDTLPVPGRKKRIRVGRKQMETGNVTSKGVQQGLLTECLQCGKRIAANALLSIEVKDQRGTRMGYLHRLGTCKADWDNARPRK
jgi:hypothetical protein